MAVVKVSAGANAGKYAATNKAGVKQYFSSQSAAVSYAKTGGSSSSSSSSSSSGSSGGSSTTTQTSAGQETVQQTVDRAKALLGDAYNPNTTVNEPVAQTVARATAMNAQTTAQGSTPFAGSTFEAAYLAAPETPISPDQIQRLSAVTAPTVTPTIGTTTGSQTTSSALTAVNAAGEQQLKDYQARIDKLELANKSLIEKTIGSQSNPEDVFDQAWKDTGMSAKEYFATQEAGIAEIDTLNAEYANVKAQMDTQIAQTNDKMASMNFINNQTAQIRNNAAPELNRIAALVDSKAATLQALQGNFAEARSLVRDAVDAAVAGNKFLADQYSAFYEQNIDNFNRTEAGHTEAYKTKMEVLQEQYQVAKAEKSAVGELLLNNLQAGITLADTLDQAMAKVGMNPKAESGQIIGSAETGYYSYQYDPKTNKYITVPVKGGTGPGDSGVVTPGFSTSKIESSVREDATTLRQTYGNTPEGLQNAYTDLRTLYSPSEASDQALKDLLGIVPPPAPEVPGVTQSKAPRSLLGDAKTVLDYSSGFVYDKTQALARYLIGSN